MKKASNYLGIDWGAVKVGVALAHKETKLALAYATLQNDQYLLKRLGAIIAAENIAIVVIGIAIRGVTRNVAGGKSLGNHQDAEHAGKKLGRLIEKRFSVSVVYQNEMFTTKMAQDRLKESGAKRISKIDDAEAARIILQEWLDANQ